MRIAFVCNFPKGIWQWQDGLRGALRVLEKKHTIVYSLNDTIPPGNFDFLFVWSCIGGKAFEEGRRFNGRKILFFSGGVMAPLLSEYFCLFENEGHVLIARDLGIPCMKAFGTDVSVFKPMKQPKIFDVFYPGAFGLWKRKDLFAQSVQGLRAFSCGNIQEHEMQCFDVCVENGVAVSPDLPQENLPYFYNMSKSTLVLPVPEIGCQRTVLESMACKVPVIVPSDAALVVEYARHGGIVVHPDSQAIREGITQAMTHDTEEAYQYVMDNLTEQHYAQKIEEAMEMVR